MSTDPRPNSPEDLGYAPSPVLTTEHLHVLRVIREGRVPRRTCWTLFATEELRRLDFIRQHEITHRLELTDAGRSALACAEAKARTERTRR